jgi:hypothetical protein
MQATITPQHTKPRTPALKSSHDPITDAYQRIRVRFRVRGCEHARDPVVVRRRLARLLDLRLA